jgi:hypothetical protein
MLAASQCHPTVSVGSGWQRLPCSLLLCFRDSVPAALLLSNSRATMSPSGVRQRSLQTRQCRVPPRSAYDPAKPPSAMCSALAWKGRICNPNNRSHRCIDLSQNRSGIPPSPTTGPGPPVIETRVPSRVIVIRVRAPPVMTVIPVHLSEIAGLCLNRA